MKALIYIAGPYTEPDPIMNVRRAVSVGMELWRTGQVAVLIPHLSMFAHLVMPQPIDEWYAFDIDQLEHCDALYRLDGASHGADMEVAFAEAQNIPVFAESERERLMAFARVRRAGLR